MSRRGIWIRVLTCDNFPTAVVQGMRREEAIGAIALPTAEVGFQKCADV